MRTAFLSLLLATATFAQDVVTPNEQLVVEGVPPIPKKLQERVAMYTEGRSASFLSWHPVNRDMLIATRFAEVAQVHRVASPGAARTQQTFYPERVSEAMWRPIKGDGWVFSKDIGGAEFFQIYWRDAKTGETTLITDGTSRNTDPVWSSTGNWLAYSSTKRNKKDTDLYVIDPTRKGSEKMVLQCEGGGWTALDLSKDEKWLLAGEYLSANESKLWLVDMSNGTKKLLTPGTEKTTWAGGKFVGGKILTTTDQGGEFKRLVLLDPAGGTPQVVVSANWDVEEFAVSPDASKVAYILNEAGVSKLRVRDLASGQELTVPSLPVAVIGGLEWHSNGQDLAFTLSGARNPADAWSLNVGTGKLDRWTFSETGGLDPSTFAEATPISWKSFDGQTITGFLYKPSARFAGPRPVLVNIHGGPEVQFQPTYQGRNNFYMNELGIAMICPNVRGSTGFGKTYLAMDNWEKREDSVKDIGALLDWIKTQPDLDPTRVMVMGGSYGGYMSLASMTNYNDRLRGGIDVVGISNFVTFLENTEAYRRDLRRVEYGDERIPKMRELLLKISPTTNAARITKPMFIIQGKNDPRVPLSEAEQMVATIRKNGGSVWYLMAKDEGHGFSKKKNSDFQFLAMLRFFEEVLLK